MSDIIHENTLKRKDFWYFLPEKQIAQFPLEPRDSSKLLVYNRKTDLKEERLFFDIADYLNEGDVLVLNRTRVIPARIFGKKESGANIEFLLHKRINYTDWEVLARPAKRVKIDDVFLFSPDLKAKVLSLDEDGIRVIRFEFDGVFEEVLSRVGQIPLPHYIHESLKDRERYQTIYAKVDGSSAAPTAGLHFTEQLFKKIKNKGIKLAEVLLHIGLGTFRPVKADNIIEHKMHSEYYEISEDNAKIINDAKSNGKRVVAVGTTSVRVLETAANQCGSLSKSSGFTDIFIYPQYDFKVVDALITNFHLPESTLIMLVSAFCSREKTLEIYNFAVKNNYRFFSFGDACLFL